MSGARHSLLWPPGLPSSLLRVSARGRWCLPRITARFLLWQAGRGLNGSLLRDRSLSRYQCRPSSPPVGGLGFLFGCVVVLGSFLFCWGVWAFPPFPFPPWPAPNSFFCTVCDNFGCPFGPVGLQLPSLGRGVVAAWPGCGCLRGFVWPVVVGLVGAVSWLSPATLRSP